MNTFETKDITFSRGGNFILQSANLAFEAGKLTAIMGGSGVGKSTLLHLLTGRLLPDSGEIYFQEKALSLMSQQELYQERRSMSLLFQGNALFTDLNVFDNVAFVLREVFNETEAHIAERVQEALVSVGLWEARNYDINALSGGMMRRVAFARAVVAKPSVIMLDEPFVGQDPITKSTLVNLIEQAKSPDRSIILVSHDVPETLLLADYCYLITREKIYEGTPKGLFQSGESEVKRFLHYATALSNQFGAKS